MAEIERFVGKVQLFSHQLKAFQKLVNQRNMLYLGKTGSGKTLVTLMGYAYLHNKSSLDKMLVMTPRNAYDKKVWEKDIKKLTNMKCIDIEILVQKTGGDLEKVDHFLNMYPIVYMKHTHLFKYHDLLISIITRYRTLIVVDEVHAFKNPKSKLRAYFNLVCSKYAALWALTATPVSKDMNDFYSIMQMVKPWYLGDITSFKRNYCTCEEQIIGRNPSGGLKKVERIIGVSNAAALQMKIEPYVIAGDSLVEIKHKYVDYEMNAREMRIYQKLGKGAFASRYETDTLSAEDWFKKVMGESVDEEVYVVKDNQRHSSRFLYLQFAADGIISDDGVVGREPGEKMKKLLRLCAYLQKKGESSVIYFDYYASLNCFKKAILQSGIPCKVLDNTGEKSFKSSDINENLVKTQSYFILSTKAGSASESLYYINNVILFHVPTVPETFTQVVGRITRINTLFPGNLNCWIFRSENIDMYKLAVVSHKAAQAEVVANEESNIPPEYKHEFATADAIKLMKRYLLWQNDGVHRVLT